MTPALRLVAVVAVLALPARAQGAVLVVDAVGGPYASIQAAIDAASDGDVILAKFGTYPGFVVNGKGLTITCERSHVVTVNGTFAITNLAASQTVVLRGLRVTALFVPGTLTPPPTLQNVAGAVWVEDCIIVDSNLGPSFSGYVGHGVAIDSCASVVFARCSITGSPGSTSGAGIHSTVSSVSVYDCALRGADSAVSIQLLPGGDALVQDGGFFFASGTDLFGGKGNNGVTITVSGFPPVCHNGGPGGNGLVLSGVAPSAQLLGCSITPGAGGMAQTQLGCTNGLAGQTTVVNSGTVTFLSGVPRQYRATSPIRGGQSTTLTFQAPAGEAVGLAYWIAPGNVFLPAVLGPLLIGFPPVLSAVGTTNPSAFLSVSVLGPDPGPGLVGVTLFSQSFFVAGSSVFLGAPSAVTVLNSGVP